MGTLYSLHNFGEAGTPGNAPSVCSESPGPKSQPGPSLSTERE